MTHAVMAMSNVDHAANTAMFNNLLSHTDTMNFCMQYSPFLLSMPKGSNKPTLSKIKPATNWLNFELQLDKFLIEAKKKCETISASCAETLANKAMEIVKKCEALEVVKKCETMEIVKKCEAMEIVEKCETMEIVKTHETCGGCFRSLNWTTAQKMNVVPRIVTNWVIEVQTLTRAATRILATSSNGNEIFQITMEVFNTHTEVNCCCSNVYTLAEMENLKVVGFFTRSLAYEILKKYGDTITDKSRSAHSELIVCVLSATDHARAQGKLCVSKQ